MLILSHAESLLPCGSYPRISPTTLTLSAGMTPLDVFSYFFSSGIATNSLVFVQAHEKPEEGYYFSGSSTTLGNCDKNYYAQVSKEAILKGLAAPDGEKAPALRISCINQYKGDLWHSYLKYYVDNPFYGKNNKFLEPPPVKRLYNIYGKLISTNRHLYDLFIPALTKLV